MFVSTFATLTSTLRYFLAIASFICLSLCLPEVFAQQKIFLDPSMISLEAGSGDPGKMLDEQSLAGEPALGQGGNPSTLWFTGWGVQNHPAHAIIDLGEEYAISQILLRDINDVGQMSISAGSAGNWIELFNYQTSGYLTWSEQVVNTRTRYLRVSIHDQHANISEIVLYGTATGNDGGGNNGGNGGGNGGGNTPAPPVVGPSGKLMLSTAMMMNESGYANPEALVDEQDAAGDPMSGSGGSPTNHYFPGWSEGSYPAYGYLDLGQAYDLSSIFLRDIQDNGAFNIWYGSPGNWTPILDYNTAAYNEWSENSVNIRTRYLRFGMMDKQANIAEVVLYGRAVEGGGSGGGNDDVSAPAAVTDLTVGTITANSINLSWTAPGDDDATGTAASYDLRYNTSIITAQTFGSAMQVNGEPTPAISGSSQMMTVSGLQPGTTYYFALKTSDEIPNQSAISNLVIATTVDAGGGGNPQESKIILLPDMVFSENFKGDPLLLVDEQGESGDPANGTGGMPTSTWFPGWGNGSHPAKAYIDLGKTYNITKIFLRDVNDIGRFDIGYGTPDNWTIVISDYMSGYQVWNQHNVNITTRYIHVAMMEQGANVSEILLYGMEADAGGGPGGPTDPDPDPNDITPPAVVQDLTATSATSSSISLAWTSPGDDGPVGTATSYDIRYSLAPITAANFAQASQAVAPTPLAAGNLGVATVTGLSSATTYYFALTTTDDAGNTSSISNIASRATSAPNPSNNIRTYGQYLGTNFVLDNHGDKIGIFKRLRLYLHTPNIAENASGPQDLAFDPIDGFGGQICNSNDGCYSMDELFQRLTNNGVEVQATLEGVPGYIGVGANRVAARAGADTNDPASFAEHAEMCFQVAARYGGTAVDLSKIKIRAGQTKKTGLGTVKRIQPYNETYEHWEGGQRSYTDPWGNTEQRAEGDWSPEEEAAMMKAVYDRIRHQENLDIKVVWPGMVKFDRDQLARTKRWIDEFNNGQLPADEFQIHIYWNRTYSQEESYKQAIDFSGGASHPESWGGLRQYAENMVNHIYNLFGEIPIIIGEIGYDRDGSPQQARPIGGTSSEQVQADWLVRSYLALFAAGIDQCVQYMIDHVWAGGEGWLFGSSGLIDGDNTIALTSWYYTAGTLEVLQNATFSQVIPSGRNDVEIYEMKDGNKTIYAIWCPTAENKVVDNYQLPVSGSSATLMKLQRQATTAKSSLSINGGNVSVSVTETPQFIVVE